MFNIKVINNEFLVPQYGNEFINEFGIRTNNTDQIGMINVFARDLHMDLLHIDDYDPNDKDVYFIIQSYNVHNDVYSTDTLWICLPDKIKKGLQSGNLRFIVDTSFEATDLSESVYNFCTTNNIPEDNVFYFIGNLLVTKSKMKNTYAISCFEYLSNFSFESVYHDPLMYTNRLAKYVFYCGKVKVHRMIIMLHLLKTGALDSGYTSCWGNYNLPDGYIGPQTDYEMCLEYMESHFSSMYDKYKDYADDLVELLPLYVDGDPISTPAREFTRISPSLYKTSYYSIVVETDFYTDDILFITEKTFKPISQKHPFIIAGAKGTLAHLREMGYKTFHPYIDETYDTLDSHYRLLAIMEEIDRLNNMSKKDWDTLYKQIAPILEYNYERFRNVDKIFEHCGLLDFFKQQETK